MNDYSKHLRPGLYLVSNRLAEAEKKVGLRVPMNHSFSALILPEGSDSDKAVTLASGQRAVIFGGYTKTAFGDAGFFTGSNTIDTRYGDPEDRETLNDWLTGQDRRDSLPYAKRIKDVSTPEDAKGILARMHALDSYVKINKPVYKAIPFGRSGWNCNTVSSALARLSGVQDPGRLGFEMPGGSRGREFAASIPLVGALVRKAAQSETEVEGYSRKVDALWRMLRDNAPGPLKAVSEIPEIVRSHDWAGDYRMLPELFKDLKSAWPAVRDFHVNAAKRWRETLPAVAEGVRRDVPEAMRLAGALGTPASVIPGMIQDQADVRSGRRPPETRGADIVEGRQGSVYDHPMQTYENTAGALFRRLSKLPTLTYNTVTGDESPVGPLLETAENIRRGALGSEAGKSRGAGKESKR